MRDWWVTILETACPVQIKRNEVVSLVLTKIYNKQQRKEHTDSVFLARLVITLFL